MLEIIKSHINDRYGSRRGFLNYCSFGIKHRLGRFRQYETVDWGRVGRLVFICYGNICRSPLGEGVAKALGITAASYGLQCRDGAPADERAIAYASSIGLDLTPHRTQNIRHYVPSAADLLVVMEPWHLEPLQEAPFSAVQITLAGLWGDRRHPYIHDPYTASDMFFNNCENHVKQTTEGIARRVVNLAPQLSVQSAASR